MLTLLSWKWRCGDWVIYSRLRQGQTSHFPNWLFKVPWSGQYKQRKCVSIYTLIPKVQTSLLGMLSNFKTLAVVLFLFAFSLKINWFSLDFTQNSLKRNALLLFYFFTLSWFRVNRIDPCPWNPKKGFVWVSYFLSFSAFWAVTFSLKTYMNIYPNPNIFYSLSFCQEAEGSCKETVECFVNISERSCQLHSLFVVNLFIISISHYD